MLSFVFYHCENTYKLSEVRNIDLYESLCICIVCVIKLDYKKKNNSVLMVFNEKCLGKEEIFLFLKTYILLHLLRFPFVSLSLVLLCENEKIMGTE